MRRVFMLAAVMAGASVLSGQAIAASCYDLWYERNEIYDQNGYCFSTKLGRDTFDNSDCWTKSPKLSRAEQRRVEQIRKEERRRKCKVNR
jgi:hypothetical protein